MSEVVIEVSNLKKQFGHITAVENLSFSISRGEILGFLGPNGAGKSTTMRMLTCFIPQTEGTATVAGHNINEQPFEVRKRIGYLPENTPLYTHMTVFDFLYYIASLRNIAKPKDRIEELTEICGLETVLHREIEELSKGFRQRVGLAQALMADPEILILDEPTSGLDPKQIIEIRELIKEIGKEKTVILCSHILSEVAATCNRVIIINKGKIVGDGTPEELQESITGHDTLYAKIRCNKDVLEKGITKLKDISSYTIEDTEAKDVFLCKLKVNKGAQMNERIFKWVVKNKWSLLELRTESLSLEDVFMHLTTEVN